jgi:Ca2+-binding RTX toxin-like protein
VKLTTLGAAGLLLLAAVSIAAPADAAPRTCAGKRVTIVGTPGDDHINGTRHADVIDGLGGSDVINGLQGNDTICGNYGADDLRGNAGNDRLYGGKDAYTFNGAEDWIRYGDTLRGGSGDDVIVPGLDPRDGWIVPGDNADVDDLVTYDTAPRAVHANLETQVVTGDGTDRVVDNGRLRFFGTPWADVVVGSQHGDEIWLFGGNDKVSDGAGNDLLVGGDGTDDNVHSDGGSDRCASIELHPENC